MLGIIFAIAVSNKAKLAVKSALRIDSKKESETA
jgi:hypothetical protein